MRPRMTTTPTMAAAMSRKSRPRTAPTACSPSPRPASSGAFWWAVANPPAWALGWLVTSYVITRNVQDQFTNFGASGALVFGLLTWLLLTMLFRETEPQATRWASKTPPPLC
jgi:hypothetical protein